MATRSIISVKTKDNKINSIYCQWNGDPSHHYPILSEYYNTQELAEELVMNGDLLTDINFKHLLDYHISQESIATMCIKEYDSQVPYGVVNLKDNIIKSIDEKPIHSFFVSAGIYILSPKILNYIPNI